MEIITLKNNSNLCYKDLDVTCLKNKLHMDVTCLKNKSTTSLCYTDLDVTCLKHKLNMDVACLKNKLHMDVTCLKNKSTTSLCYSDLDVTCLKNKLHRPGCDMLKEFYLIIVFFMLHNNIFRDLVFLIFFFRMYIFFQEAKSSDVGFNSSTFHK